MNDDLISRSALRKQFGYTDEWYKSRTVAQIIDNAPPIETTIDTLMSTLSVETLKATTWVKVDTPSGESFVYRREKTGHWIYRNFNWWCSECGEQPKTMGYVGTAKFMCDEFKFCNHCGTKMTGGEIYE